MKQKKAYIAMLFALALIFLGNVFIYSQVEKDTKVITENAITASEVSELVGAGSIMRQSFIAVDGMKGIEILFATYQSSINDVYEFCVFEEITNELITKTNINGKEISDGEFFEIEFDTSSLEEGKKYYFEINKLGKELDALSYWLGDGESYLDGEFICNGNDLQKDVVFEYLMDDDIESQRIFFIAGMAFVDLLVVLALLVYIVRKQQSKRIFIYFLAFVAGSILIYATTERYTDRIAMNTMSASAASELIGSGIEMQQTFEAINGIKGLRVLFATYTNEISDNYEFCVYDENTDKFITKTDIEGADIKDGRYLKVEFDTSLLKKGQTYYFKINKIGTEQDTLSYWLGEGTSYPNGEFICNGQDTGQDVVFDYIIYGPNVRWIAIVVWELFIVLLFVTTGTESISNQNRIKIVYGGLLVFGIAQMFFYANYVGEGYDETAQISYIAYLEKENVIIPEFENMNIIMEYNEPIKENPYDNVLGYQVTTGIFETKFSNAINYLGHAPLYFHIMKLAHGIEFGESGKIYINLTRLRYANIVLNVIALILIFYIGYSRLGNDVKRHLMYGVVVVSFPFVCYSGATINNDNLSLLVVSLGMLGFLRFLENKRDFLTYLIVAVAISSTMLNKLTAGLLLLIAGGIIVLVTFFREKNAKSILNYKFLCTLPIYIIPLVYFLYIYKKYGTFQPSIATLSMEQFLNARIFYIPVEERGGQLMGVMDYLKSFVRYFSTLWVSGIPHGRMKRGINFILWGLPYLSLLVLPLTMLKEKWKKKTAMDMVVIALYIGMIITIIVQAARGYSAVLTFGHAGMQSRYYVCVIAALAVGLTNFIERILLKREIADNLRIIYSGIYYVLLALLFTGGFMYYIRIATVYY